MCDRCVEYHAPKVAALGPAWHFCALCMVPGRWRPVPVSFFSPAHAGAGGALEVLEGAQPALPPGQPAPITDNLSEDFINELLMQDAQTYLNEPESESGSDYNIPAATGQLHGARTYANDPDSD